MIMMEKLDSLRGKPEELMEMKSVRQLVDDLTKANWLLWLAGTAAFLASGMFVVKYFIGGDLTPSAWTGEQWINAWLGLLLTLVVTFGQGLLYASGYKGPAAFIATCVVVFFGLFSEVSQSMEREDATVRHRSENSPVFQAALGSIGKLTEKAAAPSPAQHGLATAQGEVHRWEAEQQKKAQCHTCSEYSTRTIGSNLAQAQGRVAAAREQLAIMQAGNASALTGAIAQAKTLEYDEDKHCGMIRLLRSLFGIEGIFASFLFSVVVIGTFEYIFHFIGTYVGNHRKALQLLGLNTDGSPFDPPPSLPALPVPLGSAPPANLGGGSAGNGASVSGGSGSASVQPLPGMQPADPFARDRLRMDYSTTNPAYPMPGFAPPMPSLTPDLSVLMGGLSGLTGKVKNRGRGTGTPNTGSATVGKGAGKYLTGKVGEGNEVQVAESVYLTLCKLVRAGQLRPSRPGIKRALQKMQVGNNQVERQAMADLILRHMEQDGAVYRNPAYTGPSCGLAEFLPVLDRQQDILALAG
jgi:cytochrome c2